jgi:hypothetical protein
MGRPYGSGRATCESCISIDVRHWHRRGRLCAGQYFSWAWSRDGEPVGNINVRTESDAVILIYRSRNWGDAEWRSVNQRVPITWTTCHLGGRRPWFVCSVYSGGRVIERLMPNHLELLGLDHAPISTLTLGDCGRGDRKMRHACL